MSLRIKSIHFAIAAFMAMLLGCGRSDRLVVFADPWLTPFAEKALATFGEEHPDMEIEMRSLSSEVIVQHLHFGQPMDVFLCFRPQIMKESGLGGAIGGQYPLGKVDLVLVETLPGQRNRELGADSCIVVAASGRPLRQLTEEWRGLPQDTCLLYADFCRQTQDYLLRGWVAGGFVPGFFARQHADRLRVVKEGPTFEGALMAIRLAEAPHTSQANLFMDFLRSEKCKTLLAGENINP
jgi:DNA-binding transcriptional LysR family regulator